MNDDLTTKVLATLGSVALGFCAMINAVFEPDLEAEIEIATSLTDTSSTRAPSRLAHTLRRNAPELAHGSQALMPELMLELVASVPALEMFEPDPGSRAARDREHGRSRSRSGTFADVVGLRLCRAPHERSRPVQRDARLNTNARASGANRCTG